MNVIDSLTKHFAERSIQDEYGWSQEVQAQRTPTVYIWIQDTRDFLNTEEFSLLQFRINTHFPYGPNFSVLLFKRTRIQSWKLGPLKHKLWGSRTMDSKPKPPIKRGLLILVWVRSLWEDNWPPLMAFKGSYELKCFLHQPFSSEPG